MAGLGVAVLNDLYVRQPISDGQLVGIGIDHSDLGRIEVHGVVRSGRRLSRSASALLDLIEKQGRSNP